MTEARRYPRIDAKLNIVVRQDMRAESTTTQTIGRGGLTFETANPWREDSPIALSILESDPSLELLGRVVNNRPGVCAVGFRTTRRGEPPDLRPLGPELNEKLLLHERICQMRLPVLLRLPSVDLSWYSFRFSRATLTGLDSLGGFVLSRYRPEIGSPAILATRANQWLGRIEKIESSVVRHGKTGFGVEFTTDNERRKKFYRAIADRFG